MAALAVGAVNGGADRTWDRGKRIVPAGQPGPRGGRPGESGGPQYAALNGDIAHVFVMMARKLMLQQAKEIARTFKLIRMSVD
jgi:hypothetical protein